jgi:hypothetical protein
LGHASFKVKVTEASPSRSKVNAINWLRWLLLVPSAFTGWYVGLIVSLAIYRAHKAICPAHYLVSGMCHAPWTPLVQNSAINIGSILAGALVVLLPAFLAPSHRKRVAWIAFGLGFLYSMYFLVLLPDIWHAVLSSVIGGGIVLWRFCRTDSVASKEMT